MKSNIFITGRSGVGKSSVSQRLKKTFPAGATIELDFVQALLHTELQADSLQYHDVFRVASLMALHFMECGYGPIITVGNLTDSLLQEWEKAGAPGETRVYTLTATDEVLRQRNSLRSNLCPPRASPVFLGQRIAQPLRAHREIVIDTSALNIEGVCKALLNDLCQDDEITCEDQNIFTYA